MLSYISAETMVYVYMTCQNSNNSIDYYTLLWVFTGRYTEEKEYRPSIFVQINHPKENRNIHHTYLFKADFFWVQKEYNYIPSFVSKFYSACVTHITCWPLWRKDVTWKSNTNTFSLQPWPIRCLTRLSSCTIPQESGWVIVSTLTSLG